MVRKDHWGIKALLFALALLSARTALFAQENSQTDSLVRLMKATSIELIEKWNVNYRKAIDATFLHNGTYLICDTALWNVEGKVINAWGNVKVIQDETMLTSEKMDYRIDEDLVQCRGPLVQLENKKNNILRTRFLDYNTKDSIAVFRNGAAMRDEDGQIIESIDGTYDSRAELFNFNRNVNMFTDSVFVKTASLVYDSNTSMASFNSNVDFWKDDNMLSADSGWYDRLKELFFFTGHVHGLSRDQEIWSDSLYFHRVPNNVELFGRAQLKDTTRNVVAVGEYIFYEDSLSRITLRDNAAVAMRTEQDNAVDTLYFGADKIVYETLIMGDVPDSEIKNAETRIADFELDPVSEYRRKAAEEAAKAAEEQAKNDPNRRGSMMNAAAKGAVGEGPSLPSSVSEPEAESKTEPEPEPEQEAEPEPESEPDFNPEVKPQLEAADSLAQRDSLPPPKDSTKVGFLRGVKNVRIFRKDMQVRCDSIVYNDLDSIARFHIDPIVWNDGNRQYTADSLFLLVRNGGAEKASLMSNAFIITQEDSLAFDQIKGSEVMAYFDSTSALSRFDALGGASALFFLKENDAIATVNKVECKMLSAIMNQGELDRVSYFEQPHNDAYPIVQMTDEDRRMKGFNWCPESRPSCPDSVSTIRIRASERSAYEARPRTEFTYTEQYFPGYMKDVYRSIAVRDSLKRVRDSMMAPDLSEPVPDSSFVKPAIDSSYVTPLLDSTSVRLSADSTIVKPVLDSTSVKSSADSLPARVETEKVAPKDPVEVPTVDQAQRRRELREEARKLKIAKRDARWAELDARDAAKEDAKKAKALEKKRVATMKAVQRKRRQEAKDEAKLKHYVRKYERAKAKAESRGKNKKAKDEQTQSESAGERPQGVETGRSVQAAPGAGGEALGGKPLFRGDGPVDDRDLLRGGSLSGT